MVCAQWIACEAKNDALSMYWHKMDETGRYEVTAYVS